MRITTKRLTLIAISAEIAASELAFLEGKSTREPFEQLLGARVTTWPTGFYDSTVCAYFSAKLSKNPEQRGWWQWHMLLNRKDQLPLLIGATGFTGPPDALGTVEIGYSIVEDYQKKGLTPEAVRALTQWAFSHEEVRKIIITVVDVPELEPSRKVAQKSGFSFAGKKMHESELLSVYELNREDFSA
jgi:[ribosomal protein S5]-alanine N-acetyltransferase